MKITKTKRQGFTLIEMVIAIALGAVILVAASSLLLSITQIWIKSEHLDDFQGHVHGVKTFLQTHINESYFRINEKLPTVEWSSPPGIQSAGEEAYLSFYVYTPSPLFRTDSLVPIVCYLSFDKKNGLSIIWHSLEKASETSTSGIYETPLSQWVIGIKLHYYNFNNNHWDVVDRPRKGKDGKFELPDLIELQFAKEKEENQSSFIRLRNKDQKTEEVAQ